MSRLLVLLASVACVENVPPPSADVAGDDRLAALPADASFVASADLRALAGAGASAALFEEAGLATAPWTALAQAGAGVPGLRMHDARVGCGGEGCVALLEGEFSDAGIEAAMDLAPAGVGLLVPEGDLLGFDVQLPRGEPWVFRRLSDDKAVFGERAAVRAVWHAQRNGTGGLEPAELAGRIPPGEAWLLIRDPERFAAQAGEHAGPTAAARLQAGIAHARERLPRLDDVDTIALAASTGDTTLRGRVVCEDDATAADVEFALRGAIGQATGLRDVHVSRAGSAVEVSGIPDAAALARALGGVR